MKLQPVKGTRDFLPEEMIKRNYVIEKIKRVFISYGFDEVQTPVFEDFDLLTKKCGEEIKEQIFYFKDKGERELGLRFDLTVPLCRIVAANPQIPKPFKRFCIAPVWRYEEVTKGRKREFYQCDIDIIGSNSMEADVECIACAIDCLKVLGFRDFEVLINNRKILDGFIELIKADKSKNVDIFRAIDKLKKFGKEKVRDELRKCGLSDEQIKNLFELILVSDNETILEKLKDKMKNIEVGIEGLKELEEIFEKAKLYGIYKNLKLDLSLARGLDYYTGPIFEIILRSKERIGSIAGGGRYDNLIEMLGGRPTPATGISLGIERIIEIMKEERMLELPKTNVKVFIANVDEKVKGKAIEIAKKLRKEGISCQVDLMERNLKKQLDFANRLEVPFSLIVGLEEIKEEKVKIKDMKSGKEYEVKIENIIKFFKNQQ